MSNSKAKLSESIAQKYECDNPTVVEYPIKEGRRVKEYVKVDLTQDDVSKADGLYEYGYKGLRLKKTSSAPAVSKK